MRAACVAAVTAMVVSVSAGCTTEQPRVHDPCHPVQAAAVVSWSPPLLPLKLSISSSGRVTVALTAQWVTPLGTFGVTGEGSHTFVSSKPASHLLVIRAVEGGEWKETGYEIDCDRSYRVFLNGTFTADVDRERTTITVEPNTESVVSVVDRESDLDPDMKPLPEFERLHDRVTVQLPDPLAHNGLGVDLDTLTVGEFVAGSDLDSDDADVWDEYSTGLNVGYHGAMGDTQLQAPTPEQCRDEANKNATGDVEPAALSVGRTFCVTTSKGNVAFLRITNLAGPYPERYAITLEATVWMKAT